ncbi:MAG: ThuA domain-containing protein [Vicinamibacterales bacterium]
MRRRFLCAVVVALGLTAGCNEERATPIAPTATAANRRVLVVTHTTGFRHSSISLAESIIEQLGRSSGAYSVVFCRTAADVARLLTPAGLGDIDAVVFANTTGNLGIPELQGFLDWVAAGHGFAGMHSAADTYRDAPTYLALLGNELVTHGDQAEVNARVENATHPAVAHFGGGYRVFDEIYRFAQSNRASVNLLLSVDRAPLDGLPDAGQPGDLPLAWFKTHGAGRVFYTALGHREEVWQDTRFQQHVLGGIRWALER